MFAGLLITLGVLLLAAMLLSMGHALLFKRDPRAQLAWLLTILMLPALGLVAYWVFGVNRIRRRGRRMRGLPEDPGPLPTALRVHELPPTTMHDLAELCERVTKRPLTSGNALRPLHNGEEAYPAMLGAIRGAKRSIALCTYIFDGDAVGVEFADALHDAQKRGCAVRILVDGIGEKYSDVSIFRHLTHLDARRFNPMMFIGRKAAYLNMRTHRKILVVDGEVGFTGGMNIGGRHLADDTGNPDRVIDLHFELRGPVVAQMMDAFAEDWSFATRERLGGEAWSARGGDLASAGATFARVITDGPDEDFEKTQWILMGALACARRRVWIMTPYFIPGRALIGALGTAALRGVEVAVILPGQNNLRFVHAATEAYLWELLQQGVRIYYQPPPFVHIKYLLADDDFALIGSSNLDPRSLRLNFELNIELYDDKTVGKALREHFQRTRLAAREVTNHDVLAMPLWQKLRNASAKLFSPYL